MENRLENEVEGSGEYVQVNYRSVYVNDDDKECIWYDHNRYWRKGSCNLVGSTALNNTYYLNERDIACPDTDPEGKQKRFWKAKL